MRRVAEIIVDESKPDAFARSVFLQQRRTQVNSFLSTFDAPSIVFNCTRRVATTMPLQSLSLLNSDFAVKRGADLAQRLLREAGPDAFALACGAPAWNVVVRSLNVNHGHQPITDRITRRSLTIL